MSRDTRDRRPPLRASELPPNQVMLCPGEVRAVACPGCGCWQVPYHGHFRRHDLPAEEAGRGVWPDLGRRCRESGRAVWFDLSPAQWQANLEAARRSVRRPVSLQRATERALRQARSRRQPEAGAA
jgi:hypothetical protein